MAVEDDPKFPAWEKALEGFRAALEHYRETRTAPAWLDLQNAIAALAKAGAEIDKPLPDREAESPESPPA
ncbi:hypothetical protein FJ936_09115 [Mesorhizobium sp. B2-4-13]|uniref:hypothetical protein n=1 Tax=Mesorhizobium sp. B2-4-13 TaxID=2589936 RepID=UPI00114FF34C|nr:hypothetical protein [Mesorhizobium sp. B2-4-13]TPK85688.1 hypothetical protein FJ936_09115 [Mesorhizobium sp. B2-4-13]